MVRITCLSQQNPNNSSNSRLKEILKASGASQTRVQHQGARTHIAASVASNVASTSLVSCPGTNAAPFKETTESRKFSTRPPTQQKHATWKPGEGWTPGTFEENGWTKCEHVELTATREDTVVVVVVVVVVVLTRLEHEGVCPATCSDASI